MAKKKLTLSQIISIRRNRALDNEDSYTLALRIAVLIVAAWLLFTQVFLFIQASGSAMFPAVKDGDLLVGFRLQDYYGRDDVVLFEHEGKMKVGRIVAFGNDMVSLDDSGSILVNGTPQTGEILYPTYAKECLTYPYRVPEGHVFILGDYRTQSEDSRDFGPIPLKDLDAKVITVLRRRGL